MRKRLIIGITGSSGSIYGIRLLQVLARVPSIETHLVLSPSAETVIRLEAPEWTLSKIRALAGCVHDPADLSASISSGSFITHGMIVIPCSMRTLGAIAHSLADNLLTRAADVTLKERRPLILVPRETPLHLGHLRNLVAVAEMGGIVVPPIPAFYHRPRTIDDLVDHTLGKILDLLQVEHRLFPRWTGKSPARRSGRSR